MLHWTTHYLLKPSQWVSYTIISYPDCPTPTIALQPTVSRQVTIVLHWTVTASNSQAIVLKTYPCVQEHWFETQSNPIRDLCADFLRKAYT